MKVHPLSLVLVEAPLDPFVPDGEQRFKVALRHRASGALAPLTREHDSAEAALSAFASLAGRVDVVSSMAQRAGESARACSSMLAAHVAQTVGLPDLPSRRWRRDR